MKKKKISSIIVAMIMAVTVLPVTGMVSFAGELDYEDDMIQEEFAQEVEQEAKEDNDEMMLDEEMKHQLGAPAVIYLALGKESKFSLSADVKQVLYFKTTNRDSYYRITVSNRSVPSYVMSAVYNQKNKELASTHYINKGDNYSFCYLLNDGKKLTKNATHSIEVRSYDSGSCSVKVEEIPDNMGNTYNTAKAITTGTINGKIEIDGDNDYSWNCDEDWMKYTAESTGKYKFKFVNQGPDGYMHQLHYQFYDSEICKIKNKSDYVYFGSPETESISLKKGQTIYVYMVGRFQIGYKISLEKIKRENPMKVTKKTRTLKKAALKKGSKVVTAITVTKAKGTMKYAKKSGSTKLSVNKQTGKITVKKGTKKGKYTAKIAVRAAGDENYKAKKKTVTVTIKVK